MLGFVPPSFRLSGGCTLELAMERTKALLAMSGDKLEAWLQVINLILLSFVPVTAWSRWSHGQIFLTIPMITRNYNKHLERLLKGRRATLGMLQRVVGVEHWSKATLRFPGLKLLSNQEDPKR